MTPPQPEGLLSPAGQAGRPAGRQAGRQAGRGHWLLSVGPPPPPPPPPPLVRELYSNAESFPVKSEPLTSPRASLH